MSIYNKELNIILTVDDLSVMARDSLDQTLSFELTDSNTSQRTVQLETINQNRLRDELVGRNFLEQTVIGGLIEDNQVVRLVLDLLGRPLLLGLLSTR
jgi:hypothetical protein